MKNARHPLSLYIHIPFCTLKCAYCDFNSYAKLEDLIPPFVEALIAEMRLWSPVVQSRPVPTVFFGGGTPSLTPLPELARIMAALRDCFALEPEAEITLEANPGTVNRDYLRGLADLGVNRISFGVQSFDDGELKALDRIHTAADALRCYRWAREAGFQRVNLDLIYGLPFDSPSASRRAAQGERVMMERWQATLEQAIALGPEHLSLYALTVEEGTKLAHDIERGRAPAPDGDLQAAMYEWSGERLARAGYRQYEISNWCRPGEECRHNLVYWRNGQWLGLGPGAHSHLGRKEEGGRGKEGVTYRFADVYSPRQYIERVRETAAAGIDAGGAAPALLASMRQVTFVDPQPAELQMADTAILALRLNEGLSVDAFARRFGRSPDDVYGAVFAEMTALGLLERAGGHPDGCSGERIRLTDRGRYLANEVFVRLLPDQPL
ncbi:MAG: radical SAM family heme chaperone HemW [Dehalococcoidia bacterium]|nr:radical SAM family heme chaperone HemW [Dehalococcoidia bacterium]